MTADRRCWRQYVTSTGDAGRCGRPVGHEGRHGDPIVQQPPIGYCEEHGRYYYWSTGCSSDVVPTRAEIRAYYRWAYHAPTVEQLERTYHRRARFPGE